MNKYFLCAAFFAVCVCIFIARSEWERRQLRAEHYRVPVSKKLNGIKRNGDFNFKIAFFSDIHDFYDYDGINRIVELLKKESPDAAILGGDTFTISLEKSAALFLGDALDLVNKIREICATVFVPGNHEHYLKKYFPDEYEKFKSALKERGVYFLENEKIYLAGKNIAVYGICLDEEYYKHCIFGVKPEMPEKYLIGKLGLPDKNSFNILVMHNPLYLEESAAWGADLVLSGHFHGGTVNIPRLGGLMTPQYQMFYKRCSGMHSCKDTYMIVNRGLGTHSVNIRINDLPEISIIQFCE